MSSPGLWLGLNRGRLPCGGGQRNGPQPAVAVLTQTTPSYVVRRQCLRFPGWVGSLELNPACWAGCDLFPMCRRKTRTVVAPRPGEESESTCGDSTSILSLKEKNAHGHGSFDSVAAVEMPPRATGGFSTRAVSSGSQSGAVPSANSVVTRRLCISSKIARFLFPPQGEQRALPTTVFSASCAPRTELFYADYLV